MLLIIRDLTIQRATATGGQRSNAKMVVDFHVTVKIQGAVAGGSSTVSGFR